MDILGIQLSDRLSELIYEVEQLRPDQPISWELVDNFNGPRRGLAEVYLEPLTLRPTIRLLRKDFEALSVLSAEMEMIIAHELLHIWCKRRGFPRVLEVPRTGDVNHARLKGYIEDLVEHNVVYHQLRNRGYSISEYEKNYNEGMRQNSWNDNANPRDLVFKAFHIAELHAHLNVENSTKQFLEDNYPKTLELAVTLAKIVSDKNPLNPEQSRRCMLNLIRLLTKSLEYPIDTMLGLDLVLSERQLKSNAKQYVTIREINVDEQPMVQLVFSPDNMFFMTLIQADIRQIKSLIDTHSLEQLLKGYNIRFSIR